MAEGGDIDVKCRVRRVLDKLKDCSEELHEIERMMTESARDERLGLVSTVREMLGALETGLKRVSENEKSELKEESSRSMSTADLGICTHTCVHHPEIVNPGLWSKLPEDLVGVVFARLPIPRILELRKSFQAWAAMSNSAGFKGAFAEANPKVFGMLGWDNDQASLRIRILDAASKEWHELEMEFFKDDEFLYACDGGLVCFVSEWRNTKCPDCVFVYNPLTNAWRNLPDIPLEISEPILVQLVTNEPFYRVILVYREKLKSQDARTFGAFVYDSRGGSWSVMSSGLVYETGNTLLGDKSDPFLFDCATKQLINLRSCPALQDVEALRSSILKDRLFVLHELFDPDWRLVISEFTWESSRSDLRKLNDYEVALWDGIGRDLVEIFTSTGFILVTWDIEDENGSEHQFIRIYDVSAGRWRDLPPLIGDRNEKLEGLFMCELRWDADP